jgi:CheY-like chemotaxis protein
MNNKLPTALLVDDQATNLYFLKHLLSDLECELHTASNGEKAVEMARDQDYDIALIDVRMPGMDGFETASALHDLQENLPVIFITAQPKDKSKIENAIRENAIDIVFKPIDEEILLHKVKKIIEISTAKHQLDGNYKYQQSEEDISNLLEILSSGLKYNIAQLKAETLELEGNYVNRVKELADIDLKVQKLVAKIQAKT